MTDEEYLFRQTEKERKRIARGDKNKVRGGGKTVKMPSDYLSRREREALNGEVEEKSAINWIDPAPAKWDASNIAALIAALAGSGAKLTIEVTL